MKDTDLEKAARLIMILRHALGLDNSEVPYRNRFVAYEGGSYFDDCMHLCSMGFMVKGLIDGFFSVTDKGEDYLSRLNLILKEQEEEQN